jgi:hypothetical protein
MSEEEENLPTNNDNSLPSHEYLASANDKDEILPSSDSDRSIVPSSTKSHIDSLAEAKQKAQLRKIRRQTELDAADDWIKFITIKTVGISSLVVGGLEIAIPSLLTLSLTPPFTPFTLIGIGLALLGGRNSISLAKSVLKNLAATDKMDDL